MQFSFQMKNRNFSSNILSKQVQQMSLMIQVKEKKIISLQSQLQQMKSQSKLNQQYAEQRYNQLKKQNLFLQTQIIHQKQKQSRDCEEKIKQSYEENRRNLTEVEKFYQKLLAEKEQRFINLVRTIESRYDEVIKNLKDENNALQNFLIKNNNNQSLSFNQKAFTLGNEDINYLSLDDEKLIIESSGKKLKQSRYEQITTLIKQKMSMMQQLITYKKKYEMTKFQVQDLNKNIAQKQAQKKNILTSHQQQLQVFNQQIINLNQKIQFIQECRQTEKRVCMDKITQLEQKNRQLNLNLKQLDQKYLAALTATANKQSPLPITTIKSCNHTGLISQMQKNIELKNRQIFTLRQQLQEWQNMLQLNKNVSQRLEQIDSISERTKTIYKNQKEKIQKSAQKIGKKK